MAGWRVNPQHQSGIAPHKSEKTPGPPTRGFRLYALYNLFLSFDNTNIPLSSAYVKLSLQIYEFFEHGVGDCYDTGVGLETTLGGDHVGELRREVNV